MGNNSSEVQVVPHVYKRDSQQFAVRSIFLELIRAELQEVKHFNDLAFREVNVNSDFLEL